ncbi:MAG: hypothetical protein AVDCRST_MAG18-5258, partial [uncultured Thermomicrobiales bacterium]
CATSRRRRRDRRFSTTARPAAGRPPTTWRCRRKRPIGLPARCLLRGRHQCD